MAGLNPVEIAHKDEVALSMTDLATAGELNEKQMDAFREILVANAPLMADNEVMIIEQAKMKIEYAGFPNKISYPVDEHGELAAEKYSKPTMIKIPFDCQEFAGAIPLSDKSMRNNLMKGRLGPYIMQTAAPRLALDMEDYGISSDTTRVDDLDYAKFNGLIATAKASGQLISPVVAQDVNDTLFLYMRLKMPNQYWRDLPNMRYYMSPNTEAMVAYERKGRTAEAGYVYTENNKIGYMTSDGVPIKSVPNFPDNIVILTHRKNIVWAIEQALKWELEREAKKRRWLYHMVYALDCRFAVNEACVIHDNVKVTVVPSS